MMRLFLTTTAVSAITLQDAKNRPVTKVINLLKDMSKQLQQEAEEDQEVYEKMQCWCTTNDKEKTQAIRDAELLIDQLSGTVEELVAQSSRLNAEIQNLEKEVAANSAALEKAQALRTKQLAEFNQEEKDLLQSVAALKSAITVLSKHHPNFLQSESTRESLLNIATVMSHQFATHKDLIEASLTFSDRSLLQEFIKGPYQSYGAQSGQIFGILKQMKETFETNLTAGQREEADNRQAFEGLKAAKEDEIATGQQQVDTKTSQLADTDEKLAQSKQQIKDTKGSLSADEQFLLELKQKCQLTDQEWGQRQKTRQEEIAAVSQALNVLAGDDAHDTFTKTFNPDFLQTVSDVRKKAFRVLQKVASKTADPKLSAIAQQVQLDAFTKVKKAIDQMVAELKQQMDDEVKHRDWCIDGFNENERTHTNTDRDHREVLAQIEDLSQNIDTLGKQIDELNRQVVELQTQIKRAGEDRVAENKQFRQTVNEQKETQALLKKAFDHLAAFYNKKSKKPVLVQGPAAPAGFKTMEKNTSGNKVLQLLQQIINDAAEMEAEAKRGEQDAQEAYESFLKETRRSVDKKTKARVDSEENKAKKEVERSDALGTSASLQAELESLQAEELDLHKSCDFVVKNFDLRQEARGQEIDALRQAKAILSGSNFADAEVAMSGFMQKK